VPQFGSKTGTGSKLEASLWPLRTCIISTFSGHLFAKSAEILLLLEPVAL